MLYVLRLITNSQLCININRTTFVQGLEANQGKCIEIILHIMFFSCNCLGYTINLGCYWARLVSDTAELNLDSSDMSGNMYVFTSLPAAPLCFLRPKTMLTQ